ncbi:hypothetical protein AAFC00_000265 [Neodothiora populina]|uniref:DUF1783-domain-containing protein n=1 Tax=Neodothiora populina TaxID=2781224 RepID=A0ABR3PCM5_9PEZI
MPARLRFPGSLAFFAKRVPQNASSSTTTSPFASLRSSRRTLIAAPKPNSGPLMERRSDRALPNLSSSRRWIRSIPVFVLVMGVSMAAIFNYQKQSSSIVTSTLYSLRTNARARELLGDEVYFASQIPWIHGQMNQLRGKIDIYFWVKGTRQQALMRFKSSRKQRMGYFETTEWSLQTEDGTVVNLLNDETKDPFQQTPMEAEALAKQAST